MSKATENLQAAQQRAMASRPKVGGFPHLAETLRRAGVTHNTWFLPACQSLYLTNDGPVVTQGTPLVSGMTDVPVFNRGALIRALWTDQAGESTSRSFWQPRGVPELCGTTSISRRDPLHITAAMANNTSRPIQTSR